MTAAVSSPPVPALPDPPPDEQRCTHVDMTGARCTNERVRSADACRWHGGSEQRRRKQALRLADLVDSAVVTLARIMTSQTARDSDRIRAAENVLDRTGFPRRAEIQTDDAREMLLARLIALRDDPSNIIAMTPEETDDAEQDDNAPQDDYGDDGLG